MGKSNIGEEMNTSHMKVRMDNNDIIIEEYQFSNTGKLEKILKGKVTTDMYEPLLSVDTQLLIKREGLALEDAPEIMVLWDELKDELAEEINLYEQQDQVKGEIH